MTRYFSRLPFLLLFATVLTVTSCTYNTIPTSSTTTHDSRSPQMLAAKTTTPTFVTTTSAKNPDKPETPIEQTSAPLPSQSADDNQTQPSAPLPSAIISAGSAKEQEHISFTSYNPFESADFFTVDLAGEAENFHYPIDGHLLSPYGQRGRSWHSGSDIKGQQGDPIYAVFDGVVRMSRNYAGYGNLIVIRHNNGLETAYSHNSSNLVKVGQRVKSGQKIALCGRTGRASGTHCHFEVRVLGQAINPALLLDFNRRTIQDGALVVSRNSSNKVFAKRTGDGSPSESISRPVAPKQTLATNADVQSDENSTTIISATSTSSRPATAKSTTSSAASTGSPKYHTVSSGDTLYALARKYGTSVKKICALNSISENKLLQLKQKLRVL